MLNAVQNESELKVSTESQLADPDNQNRISLLAPFYCGLFKTIRRIFSHASYNTKVGQY